MTDKFQNKYRIPSTRAAWWNYADNAGYFITICTKHRAHYFGEIKGAVLQPTEIGQIVESEWLKNPSIRPDMNLDIDAYALMPNHFHAIIWIGENQYNCDNPPKDAMHSVSTTTMPPQDWVCDMYAETRSIASLPAEPPEWWCDMRAPSRNKFGPQYKNLASVLRGFKSAVTTFALKNNIEFGWQERFHDHIIRDDGSYQRIKNYIINNSTNWETDQFYN